MSKKTPAGTRSTGERDKWSLNQNGGTRPDNKREIDINLTHGQSRRDTADGVGDNTTVICCCPANNSCVTIWGVYQTMDLRAGGVKVDVAVFRIKRDGLVRGNGVVVAVKNQATVCKHTTIAGKTVVKGDGPRRENRPPVESTYRRTAVNGQVPFHI